MTDVMELGSQGQQAWRTVAVDHCLSPHRPFVRIQHLASHSLAEGPFIHILRHHCLHLTYSTQKSPLAKPRTLGDLPNSWCGDQLRGWCRTPVCVCQDYTLNEPATDLQPGRAVGNTPVTCACNTPGAKVKSTDRLGEGFRTRKQASQFCPSITLHYKNTLYSLALASSGARGIHKCSRTKIFLSWGIFGKGQTIPPGFRGGLHAGIVILGSPASPHQASILQRGR